MEAPVANDSNTVLNAIRERVARGAPSGWTVKTLGECFKWSSGGTPKRTEPAYFNGDIPWAVIGDLNDGIVSSTETAITEAGLSNSSAKWVEPGSVLVAMYGSIGKLGIAACRLTTNQAIAFTNPHPVDGKYLYYYLLWQRPSLARLGKGATQLNISQTVLKEFPFLVAPPDEQRRVVAGIEKQFSRVDHAVTNLMRIRVALKRYKASVLKFALEGCLVPTEALLGRREDRAYETGKQLLQRILEVRRSRHQRGKYKEPSEPDTTNLNALPEGWMWARLDTLCSDVVDCPHSTPKFVNIGRPCIDTTWMSEDGLRLDRARFVSDEIFRERIKRLAPKPGDIVFAREGTIGTANAIPVGMESCLGQRVMLLRPAAGVEGRFLRAALVSPLVRGQYASKVLGSTAPHVNVAEVKAFAIPLPPYAEQQRIIAEVGRHFSVVDEIETQVRTEWGRVDKLRLAILARAFSGKHVVRHQFSQ